MTPVTENVTTPATTVNILASMHTFPVLTSQCRGVAWYESEVHMHECSQQFRCHDYKYSYDDFNLFTFTLTLNLTCRL